MSQLQARGLTLRYAQEHPLFQAVDFDINPGDRIALVGPNGAGKSSLLRVLGGTQSPDGGVITKPRGLTVAHFSQSGDGDDPHLSAGQRARARLAEILDEPAGILLLDEPTNHLDARTRHWLAHQLLRHKHTCLFVSHDEDFLHQLATRVFEIRRGQFRPFTGTYAEFLHHTETLNQKNWSAYESEQRQIAAFERAAQRRDSIVTRLNDTPPGGRGAKAFYGHKAAKVARTARMLRERIAPESQVAKPWEEQPIPTLDFRNFTRPGDPAIDIQNLTLAYGPKTVLNNFNLTLRRAERWAIQGPNGSGKTSLFRAIRGELSPTAGTITIAQNVKLGYFAQEAETLNPRQTPLEACMAECTDRTWVQTILACLKLPREYANVPIAQLSLGERAKTALAQVLVSGANVLLLDEPTNHLEIEARQALLAILDQFPGAILLITHAPPPLNWCQTPI